jgi:hypothetical protein
MENIIIPEGYKLKRCVRGAIPTLDKNNLTSRQRAQLKYREKNRETMREYQREYYQRRKKKIESQI